MTTSNPLEPLDAWRDDPNICLALDKIADGADTTETLVDTIVELAKRARESEDYRLIHQLRGPGAP